jgi:DtxR family Mn-dependent transcriptional regulator
MNTSTLINQSYPDGNANYTHRQQIMLLTTNQSHHTLGAVSSTTENYLKRIFTEAESESSEVVSLGTLASSLGVTPGTVTTMMKSLAQDGLVDYTPRHGVSLTDSGRRNALQVLRRHRLVELFLVEVLGLDWSEVHEEAEVLEHVISDRLLGRIDDLLGQPTVDPHGDPIPASDGTLPEPVGVSLAEISSPATARVIRVYHEDSTFLDFAKEQGLTPGAHIEIRNRSDAGRTITVGTGATTTTLSLDVAERIFCVPNQG